MGLGFGYLPENYDGFGCVETTDGRKYVGWVGRVTSDDRMPMLPVEPHADAGPSASTVFLNLPSVYSVTPMTEDHVKQVCAFTEPYRLRFPLDKEPADSPRPPIYPVPTGEEPTPA